jgi:hypothetical protein
MIVGSKGYSLSLGKGMDCSILQQGPHSLVNMMDDKCVCMQIYTITELLLQGGDWKRTEQGCITSSDFSISSFLVLDTQHPARERVSAEAGESTCHH